MARPWDGGGHPMRYLRDLARRPVRTTLTILGITIGIWSLVVFGSMANKISALVDGGSSYYADKLTVSDASGSTGGFSAAPMSVKLADDIRAVDGVAAVSPAVMLLMDTQGGSVSMGVPPMIVGTIPGSDQGLEKFVTSAAEGRKLTADDGTKMVTVLGSDIARKDNLHPGDTIRLHDRTFEVVGVLEPTLTAPDQEAMVPFAAGQLLLHESLPPVIRLQVAPDDLATSMAVYPEPGISPEDLAVRIEAAVPNVA